MLINADFSCPVITPPGEQHWVASPQVGVERIMLDRIGNEKARATSIVRYASQSYFPRHQHPGGEEILVLSGTFCDEHGQYPASWYLRNPCGSGHQPYSESGATIFVKLWQMHPDDPRIVRVDTRDPAAWQQKPDRAVCPLFEAKHERVCLQRLQAGAALLDDCSGGAEILVLTGKLKALDTVSASQQARSPDEIYETGTWIRLPADACPMLVAGESGATCYVKQGHLSVEVLETLACQQDRS